jgi:hypothetical protein
VGSREPSIVKNGRNPITFHVPKRHGLRILCHLAYERSTSYNKFRDARSRPRWVINDINFDTSSSVPFDTTTSSGSGNGFENLI